MTLDGRQEVADLLAEEILLGMKHINDMWRGVVATIVPVETHVGFGHWDCFLHVPLLIHKHFTPSLVELQGFVNLLPGFHGSRCEGQQPVTQKT